MSPGTTCPRNSNLLLTTSWVGHTCLPSEKLAGPALPSFASHTGAYGYRGPWPVASPNFVPLFDSKQQPQRRYTTLFLAYLFVAGVKPVSVHTGRVIPAKEAL